MPLSEEFAKDYMLRLAEVEKFVAQQGTSISEVVRSHNELTSRVVQLEALAQSRLITEAREDERDKALYERLTRMEKQIDEIKGVGTKALWVFVSAIIVAVAAFLVKGGFK